VNVWWWKLGCWKLGRSGKAVVRERGGMSCLWMWATPTHRCVNRWSRSMQAKTKGSARIIQKSAGWACARSGNAAKCSDKGRFSPDLRPSLQRRAPAPGPVR
jgi:hypothetical protein